MSDKTDAFLHSQTRENLMRAFAGESQARNRYTIAAGVANKAGLAVLQGVFLFTAEQGRGAFLTFSGPLSTMSIRNGSTTTTTSPRPP